MQIWHPAQNSKDVESTIMCFTPWTRDRSSPRQHCRAPLPQTDGAVVKWVNPAPAAPPAAAEAPSTRPGQLPATPPGCFPSAPAVSPQRSRVLPEAISLYVCVEDWCVHTLAVGPSPAPPPPPSQGGFLHPGDAMALECFDWCPKSICIALPPSVLVFSLVSLFLASAQQKKTT